jgi:hypothetical protein
MHELRTGLWHWQAPHPEWTSDARWPREVSSYAIDDGERLLLIDPLAVPDELLALTSDREALIVLTAPWHERDTRALVARLGATVLAAPPDTAQDLIDKYGITAEQAGDGSPDLRWLRSGVDWFGAGDTLPVGLEAYAGRSHNDVLLWDERLRALFIGDTLADFGTGLAVNGHVADALRPLLDLPVEVVCPAHGAPTGRAALEHALAP